MKGDSDTDSDVSIEPYMAQGDAYGIVEEPPSEPMPEQTGELVDVLLWPPRVLEDQPLSLILKKNIRDVRLARCRLAFPQHPLLRSESCLSRRSRMRTRHS